MPTEIDSSELFAQDRMTFKTAGDAAEEIYWEYHNGVMYIRLLGDERAFEVEYVCNTLTLEEMLKKIAQGHAWRIPPPPCKK